MRGYFGLYWTYPVRWIGFTRFEGIDHAVRSSRTIRYQQDAIRRFVTAEKGALLAEAAFIENAPDRGTAEVAEEMATAARTRPDLLPVLIDFGVQHWRRHRELRDLMDGLGAVWVPAGPTFLDGQHFDPAAHFRKWSDATADHAATKAEHRALILRTVTGLGTAEAAAHLNRLGIGTHTGKAWAPDNMRKFLKS